MRSPWLQFLVGFLVIPFFGAENVSGHHTPTAACGAIKALAALPSEAAYHSGGDINGFSKKGSDVEVFPQFGMEGSELRGVESKW